MPRNLQWRDAKFNRAIGEYVTATGKDMSKALNRALRNTGFQTAKATPKENAADIEKELRKDKLALKIATKQLRGRIGKSYTTRKGKKRTFKRITRKQIGAKAKRLITKRQKRRGFLRASWIAAMIAAGIKGVRQTDGVKGSQSQLGSGKQATPENLHAYLGNRAWGRLEGKNRSATQAKMKAALVQGIKAARDDMMDFTQREMAKTAAKHSARHKT